jgi:hypothetical protein
MSWTLSHKHFTYFAQIRYGRRFLVYIFVAYLLKAGIVEPGETAIAKRPLYTHATIPDTSLSNVRTPTKEEIV